MRLIPFFLSLLFVFILPGCITRNEDFMPIVKYKHPVDFYVSEEAYLDWNTQKVVKHPVTKYSYGKSQQAVFMTSLRDILEESDAFNHTELIHHATNIPANDVSITVDFIKTNVIKQSRHYHITLDVNLIIKHKQKVIKRFYHVENVKTANSTSFRESENEVSEKLLRKIMLGIKQATFIN